MFRLQTPSSVVLLALAALVCLLGAPAASPAQGTTISQDQKDSLRKALLPPPAPVRVAPSPRRVVEPRVSARPSPEHSDSAVELLGKLGQARKTLADAGARMDSLKVDMAPSRDGGVKAMLNWSLHCPGEDSGKLLEALEKIVKDIPELDVTSLSLSSRTKKSDSGTTRRFVVECRATLGVPRVEPCIVRAALAVRKASAGVGLESDTMSLGKKKDRVQVRITGTAPGGKEKAEKIWRALLDGLRSDDTYVFPRSLSARPERVGEEESVQLVTSMDLLAR